MTKIYNRFKDREKRKILRNNMTVAEKILWEEIRMRKINGCRFRRQFSIKGFVIDFYAPQLKLAIEVDGGIHLNVNNRIYDKAREQLLRSFGIEFLRFTNDEIFSSIAAVVKAITKKTMIISPLSKGEMSAVGGQRG